MAATNSMHQDGKSIANAIDGAVMPTPSAAITGAAYTLAAGDVNAVLQMNSASAQTLTVPPNSAVPFPIGTRVKVVQLGAGLVTYAAGAGVTLSKNAVTLKSNGQFAVVELLKVAVNTWIASGALSAT